MRQALYGSILCLLIAPAHAQAPDNSAAETAVRSLEREWVQGQSRNDNRVLDLIFDDELIYVEYGRLVSKGEYLSRIKHDVPLTDTIRLEGMAVHFFANTCIVVGAYQEREPGGGGRTLRRWRFIDTWVYKGRRGWILVAAGASPISN